jgi:hypothetical protein
VLRMNSGTTILMRSSEHNASPTDAHPRFESRDKSCLGWKEDCGKSTYTQRERMRLSRCCVGAATATVAPTCKYPTINNHLILAPINSQISILLYFWGYQSLIADGMHDCAT